MSEELVNPNPAQVITADTTETFEDFVRRVYKTSKRLIRYGNGKPIELKPGGKYAVIALKLSEIATPAQFDALFRIIMQSVAEATETGVIPPDWFQNISTLFDLYPPEIPEQFQDGSHEFKSFLVGETGFAIIKTPLPEVIPDETEEGEEDDGGEVEDLDLPGGDLAVGELDLHGGETEGTETNPGP
jgi:hypothetical protein